MMFNSKAELALVSEFLRSEECLQVKEGLRKIFATVVLAEGPIGTLDQILVYELRSDSVVRRVWSKKGRQWMISMKVHDFWGWIDEDLRYGWLVPPSVIEIDRLRAMLPQPAVPKSR